MKSLIGVLTLAVVVLVAGRSEAAIEPWIASHPKVAYSIQWEAERYVGPGYFATGRGKVSYYHWTAQQKQALEEAYQQALTWYQSANAVDNLNETIAYPPVNIEDTSNDNRAAYTSVTQEYAWDFYLRWVAWTLVAETQHQFPWSILDYDAEELKVLLDSSSLFARVNSDEYEMASGSFAHPNFIRRANNRGGSLAAPPRYTYAFLSKSGLIGATRRETIVNLLNWGSENLVHFYGEGTYGNQEAHWQYRGAPPITRIIEGTIRETESAPRHWTAGCHGTTGFLRNVLRAANIPVQIANRCGHSQPYFMTEGLYLDHGDDIYNSVFTGLGVSAEELLISSETHARWFGDNPDNNEDHCDAAAAVGRQPLILAGMAEICGDGIDNDHDGQLECSDDECATTESQQPQKLLASDADVGMAFGSSLALSGDALLVGNFQPDGEAAYLFRRGSLGFQQEARLVPVTPDGLLSFGTSVALAGDTAFVQSVDVERSGSVHVFNRNGATWTEAQFLRASDGPEENYFGRAMAVSGSTLVVGSPGLATETPGAAYVFTRDGNGVWTPQAKLTPNGGGPGGFGSAVAIDGDVIVVGAPFSSPGLLPETGSVYAYRASGAGWIPEARIEAILPEPLAWFGSAVALSAGRLLVGSPGSDSSNLEDSGAVNILQRSPEGAWGIVARLVSPTPQTFGAFGTNIVQRGDTAIVGAPRDDDERGAAYVYQRTEVSFEPLKTLRGPEGLLGDEFGTALAIDGEVIAVGAAGDANQGANTGAAYVFNSEGTQPGQCVDVTAEQTGDPNVSLQFSNVQSSGTTHVASSSSGPAVPSGFQLGTPPTYYEITTTSTYDGPVRVCIAYAGVSYQNESALTLLHYDNGAWTDLCVDPARCQLDTDNDLLCAWADSLSPFALAQAPVADVTLTQTITRAQDGRVTISLTAKNLGPSTATAVVVTDTLPAALTYVSCATSAGGECFPSTNNAVVAAFDSLASDQSVTFSLVGCSQSPNALTNAASVVASERDPNQVNNSSSKQLAAPWSLPARQLANGDMRYAVTFPQAQAYVEAFVRRNGVQSPTGNIVGNRVNNADGSVTYYRVVPASQYAAGDVLNVRFYSYRSGQPAVFTPGPLEWVSYPDFIYGSGSTACNVGCRATFAQLPNGNVKTAYTFSTAKNYVEAFVRKNSTVVASGNIAESGVVNFDGTFTYSRTTPASQFSNGSQVSFRFYSYVTGGAQIFNPGPTPNNWFPGFVYNGPVKSDCQ